MFLQVSTVVRGRTLDELKQKAQVELAAFFGATAFTLTMNTAEVSRENVADPTGTPSYIVNITARSTQSIL